MPEVGGDGRAEDGAALCLPIQTGPQPEEGAEEAWGGLQMDRSSLGLSECAAFSSSPALALISHTLEICKKNRLF